jgi:hypothetical protein
MTREEKIKEIKLLQKQFDKHVKAANKIGRLRDNNKINVVLAGFKIMNHISQACSIYSQMQIIATQPIPKYPVGGIVTNEPAILGNNNVETITTNRSVQYLRTRTGIATIPETDNKVK